MNVIFITIAWPGEGQKNLYSDLAGEFKSRGNNVFVLHAAGNQLTMPYIINDEDGITVLRVRTGKLAKARPVRKFISLITLNRKLIKKYKDQFSIIHFDLILFPTPPISLSGFLGIIKRRNNALFYLLLKDIWPYGFADLGAIKRDGLLWKYFRWHEKQIYKIADFIGCMSPRGVDFVKTNNPEISPDKIEVCPNAIKIRVPSYIKNREILDKYGIPGNTTVFLFSGNLGKGHGLDFLVKNIISLSDYNKAYFLIGGAGTHLNFVREALISAKVANAMVYNFLPQEEFELLNASCDVGIILLDKSYSYPQFPSRLLSYLKNKMAVLCAVNQNTDIGEIIVKNKCGLSSIHGDEESFKNNIRLLCENPLLRHEMGENSWKLLISQYDVSKAYEIIVNHI